MLLVPGSSTAMQSITPEALERIRLTTNVSTQEWLEILQVQWKDYQELKLGKRVLGEKCIERLAKWLHLKPAQVISGNIDYRALALKLEGHVETPDKYSSAAFGRKRTSITSVNFLESYVGWRLRLDAIRKLSVSESFLDDPFAPISMNFMKDLCDYLHKRQFKKEDFFAMGLYTYIGNQNTLMAQLFSELESPREAFEFLFTCSMKLYEQNCDYTIKRIDDTSATVDCVTNPHVAAEAGVRHLGSVHICELKAGIFANTTRYLGLPPTKVTQTACVHRGDDVCRIELDYSEARNAQLKKLLFAN